MDEMIHMQIITKQEWISSFSLSKLHFYWFNTDSGRLKGSLGFTFPVPDFYRVLKIEHEDQTIMIPSCLFYLIGIRRGMENEDLYKVAIHEAVEASLISVLSKFLVELNWLIPIYIFGDYVLAIENPILKDSLKLSHFLTCLSLEEEV